MPAWAWRRCTRHGAGKCELRQQYRYCEYKIQLSNVLWVFGDEYVKMYALEVGTNVSGVNACTNGPTGIWQLVSSDQVSHIPTTSSP